MARNAKKCDKEEKSEKLKLKKVHVYDLRVIVAVVVIPSSIFGHALLKLFRIFYCNVSIIL